MNLVRFWLGKFVWLGLLQMSYSWAVEEVERCLALAQELGLQYAGIDLIVTPEGDIVFLELGPYSSWVWAEELGSLPLTKTFVNLLEQLSH